MRKATIRPEIQALRAIAVLLVLIYHFWPRSIPGGFIGVDVFFVISGFLITGLLLREIEETGSASAVKFWARRARRLLPASVLTLLFVVAMTILFVPLNLWDQYFADARASTAYVQNWHLAATAVDYFAAAEAPSPLQHFWSLSAEEQFYFFWPPLLLAGVFFVRGRGARDKRLAILAVMAVLTAASLAYALWQTTANPQAAYFGTPTRAWQFGAGGLLSLMAASRAPAHASAAMSWAGIALILAGAFVFSSSTPFPGTAALLPVIGAALVIRAGAPVVPWGPMRLLALRPVQFVGDVSYAVYLWHWPLLTLAPFVLGRSLDTPTKLGLAALTLLVAWLSKVYVEDPIRSGPVLAARPARWTFASAVAGMVLVLAIAGGGGLHLQRQIEVAEAASGKVLAERPECFGAAARDAGRPCVNDRLRLTVVPTPIEAKRAVTRSVCTTTGEIAGKRVCEFGARRRASRTIALVGDSHAGHWRPALDLIARRNRWRGVAVGHHGCPLSKATKLLPEPDRSECVRWKAKVFEWFRQRPEIDTVFVSQFAGGSDVESGGRDPFAAAADGYAAAWRALPASVRHIVVIRDTPRVRGNTDECVQRALERRRRAGSACAVPRRRALDPDPAIAAAARMPAGRVHVADLTRFFCDARACFPVIGGALTHKDTTHMTPVFAETLAPYLARQVEGLLGRRTSERAVAAARVCVGAAARDPKRSCRPPRLRVSPTPRQAKRPAPSTCRVIGRIRGKQLCEWGVAEAEATATVALVGDSHAGHWRPALQRVARRLRWRGVSIGHAGCPFSKATKLLPEPDRSHCVSWKREVFRWFARHPEVTAVFVSQFAGGTTVARRPGQSPFEAEVAGYARAWAALPRSVRHVAVIRDTPRARGFTDDCVERAIARRRPAGTACALPRGPALEPDPAAVAADRDRSRRVHKVDLSRFFCGRRYCYPVIGGTLVLKDISHMTWAYAESLVPYLQRAVERFLPEPA